MEIVSPGGRAGVLRKCRVGLIWLIGLLRHCYALRHPRPLADARNLTRHLRRDIGLD